LSDGRLRHACGRGNRLPPGDPLKTTARGRGASDQGTRRPAVRRVASASDAL